MLEGIEHILLDEKPDWVLLYGDTNSTLAGALAAAKLHIPIAHVEAGMRSYNFKMPEEINRVLTDRMATLLFCATKTAVANLAAEGMTEGVHNTGDVMYDASLFYRDQALKKSDILQRLNVKEHSFSLVTLHRAENTDDLVRLRAIAEALSELSRHTKIVFPLHPRTRKMLDGEGLMPMLKDATVIEPLPYLDMVRLEQSARVIMTDSGGVQKEAFFYNVPCVTIRDETEWVETVQMGFNRLVAASASAILEAYRQCMSLNLIAGPSPYGNGRTSSRICEILQTASSAAMAA
jgi:UDP-GlcNAc3NAcA epimerase